MKIQTDIAIGNEVCGGLQVKIRFQGNGTVFELTAPISEFDAWVDCLQRDKERFLEYRKNKTFNPSFSDSI